MDTAAEPVNVPPEDRSDAFEHRTDGFRSLLKGLGVMGRDPVECEVATIPTLTDEDLEHAYRGGGVAARIVDLLPSAALAQGWSVRVDELEGDGGDEEPEAELELEPDTTTRAPGGSPITPFDELDPAPDDEPEKPDEGDDDDDAETGDDVDPAEANAIADGLRAYLRRFDANSKLKQGFSLGRLFGGALAIGGFSDAKTLDELQKPRTPGSELRWLIVHDRRVATVGPLDDDPTSGNFGKPRSYEVTLLNGQRRVTVHASRVIRFPGRWAPVMFATEAGSRDPLQMGWDDSALLGCWNPLKHFTVVHETSARVARDFSRIVYKIKNLHGLIASNREDLVRARFVLMEESQSVLNAMLLDAEQESCEALQRSITGLAELMDRYDVYLAAAVGAPITELLGVSPNGFASGEDDSRRWDSKCEAYREEHVQPALERLCTWAFEDPKGPTQGQVPAHWSVTFPQLRTPSEKEKAEIRALIAHAWTELITAEAVLPEEAAEGMFGGADGFGLDIVLDRKLREEVAKTKEAEAEAETEAMLLAARNPAPVGRPGAAPLKPGAPKPKPLAPKIPPRK